jgi:hypothetical protein
LKQTEEENAVQMGVEMQVEVVGLEEGEEEDLAVGDWVVVMVVGVGMVQADGPH